MDEAGQPLHPNEEVYDQEVDEVCMAEDKFPIGLKRVDGNGTFNN